MAHINTTIWKFVLGGRGENRDAKPYIDVGMPQYATLLSVGCIEPNRNRFVWAEVDPRQKTVKRRIYLVGTGRPIPDGARIFIQTYFDFDGHVWHVYDGGEEGEDW